MSKKVSLLAIKLSDYIFKKSKEDKTDVFKQGVDSIDSIDSVNHAMIGRDFDGEYSLHSLIFITYNINETLKDYIDVLNKCFRDDLMFFPSDIATYVNDMGLTEVVCYLDDQDMLVCGVPYNLDNEEKTDKFKKGWIECKKQVGSHFVDVLSKNGRLENREEGIGVIVSDFIRPIMGGYEG